MKVHHLNCGSMSAGLVAHCLLIESGGSLTLVDTGFGTADVEEPGARLGWTRHLLRPRLDIGDTAFHQIQALGFTATDVRDIVLTHMDYDHAGGLSDFPWARVHVHGPELRHALHPTPLTRWRYRSRQWSHGPDWAVNERSGGDTWFGFYAVRPIAGLGDEITIVPLYGHTVGHVGVAVRTPTGWLLHAGDAFLSPLQLHPMLPGLLLAGAAFGEPDVGLAVARIANTARLAELARTRRGEVTLFSSHDRRAFSRLANEPAHIS